MKRTYKPRRCEYCDKEFIPLSPGQLYCSPECREKMEAACKRQVQCADIDWLNFKYESLLEKSKNQHNEDQGLLRHEYNERKQKIKGKDLKAEKRRQLDGGEDTEAEKGNNKCHDCGRPTYNYLCTQCTEKLKKKHAVSTSENFEV